MLGNSNTTQNGERSQFSPATPVQKSDAAQRLENARQRVRFALRAAEEGPLTVSTADDIARSLTSALRDLEQLSIQVAVMERKAR